MKDRKQIELEKAVEKAHQTLDFKYDLGLPGGIEMADREVSRAIKELTDYLKTRRGSEKAVRQNKRNAALELLKIAKMVMAETSLDGMSKPRAMRKVNEVLSRHTKGFFTDNSWLPVNAIWKDLTAEGIDWTLENTRYDHNQDQVPTSKTWKFKVDFINDRGRPTTMYGVVIASGNGSVENPLGSYDLVAYCN